MQLEELGKRVKEQGEELATCHKKRAEIAEELAKSSQQMQVGLETIHESSEVSE